MVEFNKTLFSSSILTPEGVRELADKRYGLTEIIECHLVQSKVHDTYFIRCSDQSFILKVYHPSQSLELATKRLEDLEILQESGINSVSALSTLDGESLAMMSFPEGDRVIELMIFAKGRAFNYLNDNEAHCYGKTMANMHVLASGKEFKRAIDLLAIFKETQKTVLNFFENDTENQRIFKKIFNFIELKLKQISIESLTYSYCHGDLHGGNAFFEDDVAEFFDWDEGGFGPCIYDMAAFKWLCLTRENPKLWQAFWEGYSSVKSLSEYEINHIHLLSLFRELWVFSLFIDNCDKTGRYLINQPFIQARIEFLTTGIKLMRGKL